jgi:ankyrin repeat protein
MRGVLRGTPPLIWATLHSDAKKAYAMTELLLDVGASADIREARTGRTAIICMSMGRKIRKTIVTDLLHNPLNDTDNGGKTALMYAVHDCSGWGRRGSLETTTKLVIMGAKLDIKGKSGKTALDYAIQYNRSGSNQPIVDFLTRFSG